MVRTPHAHRGPPSLSPPLLTRTCSLLLAGAAPPPRGVREGLDRLTCLAGPQPLSEQPGSLTLQGGPRIRAGSSQGDPKAQSRKGSPRPAGVPRAGSSLAASGTLSVGEAGSPRAAPVPPFSPRLAEKGPCAWGWGAGSGGGAGAEVSLLVLCPRTASTGPQAGRARLCPFFLRSGCRPRPPTPPLHACPPLHPSVCLLRPVSTLRHLGWPGAGLQASWGTCGGCAGPRLPVPLGPGLRLCPQPARPRRRRRRGREGGRAFGGGLAVGGGPRSPEASSPPRPPGRPLAPRPRPRPQAPRSSVCSLSPSPLFSPLLCTQAAH